MSRWGMFLLAVLVGASSFGACGGDEGVGVETDASAGTGGAGGAGASAGIDAGGSAGADAGDAGDSIDAGVADGDAAVEGCVDIHVPTAVGNFADRDHIWRDAAGVHIAETGQLVVRSYDAATGASLGERVFPQMTLMYASGRASDGTVAIIGNASDGDGGGFQALLLIRTDDPTYEELYPLPPWPGEGTDLVGVGWDGEAFAVHGFADDGTLYVTRIAEDGTVLLQPKAFGFAMGYAFESRFSTDPVSGMSYGLMGDQGCSLVAHQRDGTPVPDPPKIVPAPVQAWNGQWGAGEGPGRALAALSDGVATAFSHDYPDGRNTLIQTLDETLTPNASTIAIYGKPMVGPFDATVYDSNLWLAIEPLANGWWLSGNPNYRSIDEYVVQGGTLASRRTLVTHSDQALATEFGFDSRYFESIQWNDEIWLGFQDNSNKNATAEHPYRIIRVKPGCTYKSMTDIEHGW